jgi:hypothetical protein
MKDDQRKKIEYIVACIGVFAHATGLSTREAFQYLFYHDCIDFLIEHYDAEHTLSFEETIDDLKRIAQQSGGLIA